MQGKRFCAMLFGHRSLFRQDRFVSQKSFDEFVAVCGVICHGPEFSWQYILTVRPTKNATVVVVVRCVNRKLLIPPVELTVKQQNNNVKLKRNENCEGQGRRSS
jgi:hypothetical protein